MRYEPGQRFLTSDGKLVELRSSVNVAKETVEDGYYIRLYFVKACDRQYTNLHYYQIKDCIMLNKPSKTEFIEYLNTLPYPQKYLDEIKSNNTRNINVDKYTERVPFGNWLRRNHYREYDIMYAEWEQKQPWFTGIIEDKYI